MKGKEQHLSFACHEPAIIYFQLQTMCGSEGGQSDKWFEQGLVCLVAGCYGNLWSPKVKHRYKITDEASRTANQAHGLLPGQTMLKLYATYTPSMQTVVQNTAV